MLRQQFIGAAMAMGVFLAACEASADDFPTKQSLRRSSWNSVYTVNGQNVHALIKFDGDEGTYDTNSGQGQFSQVQYGVDTTSQPGKPFFQITGKWSFQGLTGRFTFASNGPEKFKGTWQGNGGGTWNGTAMFGSWQKDPNRDRFFCEYRYPAKNDPTTINVQVMIWYHNDPARSGYYYFANKEHNIWGRCMCPKHPNYDEDAMQWSKLMNDDWTELPRGDCPAPGDGDPGLAAIDQIPDPPA